MTENTF